MLSESATRYHEYIPRPLRALRPYIPLTPPHLSHPTPFYARCATTLLPAVVCRLPTAVRPSKRDERAPLLSDRQWSSLAAALSYEEIQAMVVVGDAPFVSDSILDARAKARLPSNVRVFCFWVGVAVR